jgi:hypothetical protein
MHLYAPGSPIAKGVSGLATGVVHTWGATSRSAYLRQWTHDHPLTLQDPILLTPWLCFRGGFPNPSGFQLTLGWALVSHRLLRRQWC